MINPTGKKLEKLLFGMFDDAIQGIDRYNHNGSLWLIFTDEMRWVVEYTKSQTLWYNYYFFTNEMEMVGLDCVEDKDLIQKWFELRFLNINPVEHTRSESFHFNRQVEDTIQNGVKHTNVLSYQTSTRVEDTIQNGVKHTEKSLQIDGSCVIEDTVQNGVKNTYSDKIPHEYDWSDQFTEEIEDTIQNGVKEIYEITYQFIERVEDTIKSGVKETCKSESTKSISLRRAIQNGVKETFDQWNENRPSVKDVIQNGVKHCEDGDWLDGDKRFEDIIQNGEKK